MKQLFSLTALAAVVLMVAGFAAQPAQDPPASPAPAATVSADVSPYALDKLHSQVMFKVRHLGISNVTGEFDDFDATMSLDPDDLSTFQASATVNVASIDTGNDRRDGHLRSDDFFNAEGFPQMTFASTGVTGVDGNMFKVNGDLTIRETTQPVTFDVELLGTATGPDGTQRAAFTAETTINRLDYGLQWNELTEAGGVIVSPEVTIILEIQGIQQ
ncbi:MAG: YceI family protein [Bacteroidota bacterium]